MKISILIITYNHESFIRQALDGALAQQGDFDVELVIGEDCSTDGTRAILNEYQALHPGKIRLLLRERNLGAVANFHSTLAACTGQYVALLEGDDYWTDPLKLHKQVTFLDANPDYAICFHNVRGAFDDKSQPDFQYCPQGQKQTLGLDDLLVDNMIPTCSAVFRRGLVPEYPRWLLEMKMGDYPLHLIHAQYGRLRYFPEIMGVYRVHGGGLWTGLSQVQRIQSNVDMFERMVGYVQPRYRRAFRTALARRYWLLAKSYEQAADYRNARRCAIRSLKSKLLTGTPSLQHKTRVLLRLSFPLI